MKCFLLLLNEDAARSRAPRPQLVAATIRRVRRPIEFAAVSSFRRRLRWRDLGAVCLLLLGPQSAISQAPALQVTTIDGSQRSGQLEAWTAQQLILRTDQQTVTLASAEILRVQWPDSSSGEYVASRGDDLVPSRLDAEQTFIELVDGTRLPHQTYLVEAGQATISTSLARQPLTLPTEEIRFVQLAADAEPPQITSQESAGDLLVIRKKGSGSFDTLAGVLGDVSEKQVEFKWDGEVIPVKRSKVAALTYYRSGAQAEIHPACWLTLANGARIPAMQISLATGSVAVRTHAGLELTFPLGSMYEADYSQGKLAYLSDLTPIYQRWTPRINLPASAELIRQHGLPRLDQSFTGSPLTLGWPTSKSAVGIGSVSPLGSFHGELRTYRKGLALRSRTELRYRLRGQMPRFITVAGIDPETVSEGNVLLEIFAGRRSVWQGEVDGSMAPIDIDVLLGDARELRILVDYGLNLDFGDRLHLAEARLSR